MSASYFSKAKIMKVEKTSSGASEKMWEVKGDRQCKEEKRSTKPPVTEEVFRAFGVFLIPSTCFPYFFEAKVQAWFIYIKG
jgi:hypothetical protein